MYSRNQSRGYDSMEYGSVSDGMSEDEYELYRYNLPPKYDGNRFRRGESHGVRDTASDMDGVTDHADGSDRRDVGEGDVCYETQGVSLCEETDRRHELLRGLISRVGYEEILIITLLIILSEDGNCGGEIILLLTFLLLGA